MLDPEEFLFVVIRAEANNWSVMFGQPLLEFTSNLFLIEANENEIHGEALLQRQLACIDAREISRLELISHMGRW